MNTKTPPFLALGLSLATMLIIGCSSNNSSEKAQLAALQQQIADSASLATATAKLTNGASYRSCVTAATNSAGVTDSTAIAACNKIAF